MTKYCRRQVIMDFFVYICVFKIYPWQDEEE